MLVAEINLAQGQTITKESVRWQAWPESAAQPTYISRSARPDARDSLVGAVLRGSVIAGEPIREEKLGPVMGQRAIVENRLGAQGSIAAE